MQRDPDVGNHAAGGTGRHHNDAVRQRDRLIEIMGDEDERAPVRLPEVEQDAVHESACVNVQRGERLIHENDFGLHDQGLCHRNALALAAGQLMRIALLESLQSDLGEPGPCLLARVRDRAALKDEPEADIVLGGLPGQQPFLLKHVAGLTVQARKRLAENTNVAGGGLQQSGDSVENGRFSAAGRPHHCNEFSFGHLEVHAFDGREVPEANHDVVQVYGKSRPPHCFAP